MNLLLWSMCQKRKKSVFWLNPRKSLSDNSNARDEWEIRRLLRDGISQEVSANDFDEFNLKRFVRSAVEGDTMVIIRDSDQLGVSDIICIAKEGKGNVVFR